MTQAGWNHVLDIEPPSDVLLIVSDVRGNRSLCFYDKESGFDQAEFKPVVAWMRCPKFP